MQKRYVIILGILLLGIVLAILSIMLSHPYEAEQPNTIQVFMDEDPHDPYNLKEIHFADIYVTDGELSVRILDNTRPEKTEERRRRNIKMLEDIIDKIKAEDNLLLTVESMEGSTRLIQAVNVSKNDPAYIYAVAEELPFRTWLVKT